LSVNAKRLKKPYKIIGFVPFWEWRDQITTCFNHKGHEGTQRWISLKQNSFVLLGVVKKRQRAAEELRFNRAQKKGRDTEVSRPGCS
jgi:hypothetical protein